MHKNLALIAKAIAEIQRCEAEGAVTEQTMLITDLKDEILRLNVNIDACAASIERLLRWINEASGRKIRIVSDAA
jgi:Ni,Fe-hydrogenase III small subunit